MQSSRPAFLKKPSLHRILFLMIGIPVVLLSACGGASMGRVDGGPQTNQQGGLTQHNTSSSSSSTGTSLQVCNMTLFDPLSFSSSSQAGTVLYTMYISSSFDTYKLVAINIEAQQKMWEKTFTGLPDHVTGLRMKAVAGAVFIAFNATDSLLLALNENTGGEIWRNSDSGRKDIAVCGDVLFWMGSDTLTAINKASGKVLWKHEQNEVLAPEIAVAQGTVFIVALPRNSDKSYLIHALAIQDGSERWSLNFKNSFTPARMTISASIQTLYVVRQGLTDAGEVLALRAWDGIQIWKTTDTSYDKIVMVANDVLYLATPQTLSAVDADNRKQIWTHKIERMTDLYGSADYGIYGIIHSWQMGLYGFDLADGATAWHFEKDTSGWDASSLVIDKASVYAISVDHNALHILDKQTGKSKRSIIIGGNTDYLGAIAVA